MHPSLFYQSLQMVWKLQFGKVYKELLRINTCNKPASLLSHRVWLVLQTQLQNFSNCLCCSAGALQLHTMGPIHWNSAVEGTEKEQVCSSYFKIQAGMNEKTHDFSNIKAEMRYVPYRVSAQCCSTF